MRFFIVQAFLVSSITFLVNETATGANVADFLDFSDPIVPGRLYVPPEAGDPADPRPLILFLHGAGQRGGDNVSQINGNIDNLLDAAKERGAFLYAPQAGPRNFMPGNWEVSHITSTVKAKIEQAISEYEIDTSRIYVTGLSMGGGGTMDTQKFCV